MNRHKEVEAYLAAAPAGQQALLKKLRTMIRKALPKADERFESKMPVYTMDGVWTAGFAARSKGPMLYVMKTELLDRYAEELGKRRSGKSCIEMSGMDMERIAARILAELGGGSGK